MKIFGYSDKECLTFFMLVVVGYFIAKLFSQKCNGFSVGAQIECDKIKNPTNCRRHRIHGCELKDGKCNYKNAPAPAPASVICNKNVDCKSGICHKNPITKLGNCVNKCSDLNPRACRVHPDKCKVENNICISKKESGDSCKENGECQTGICYNGKCSECEDLPGKVRGTDKCKDYLDKCEYKSEFLKERKCVTKQ